jgi:hypothetical protein
MQTVYLRWAELQRVNALRSVRVYAVGFRECSGEEAERDVSLAFSPDAHEIGVRTPGSVVVVEVESGALRRLAPGDVPCWLRSIPPDATSQARDNAVSPDGEWRVRITTAGRLEASRTELALGEQPGATDGPDLP